MLLEERLETLRRHSAKGLGVMIEEPLNPWQWRVERDGLGAINWWDKVGCREVAWWWWETGGERSVETSQGEVVESPEDGI